MTVVPLQPVPPVNPAAASALAARSGQPVAREAISWWTVLTLVLWTGCLTIGLLGLALPYSRPHPAARQPEPVQAQVLNVELASDLAPPPETPPPPQISQPPPLADPIIPPAAPAMIAVAQPSPAIAFALPVEGPARIVEARQAAYLQPPAQTTPAPRTASPVQRLIHGEGEGRQPAPNYPPQALRAGYEGTVTVRFNVGEDGRVLAAEAARPCPWGLLNAAAVRVVRERWRFSAGTVRVYEVAIRFEIQK